MSEDYYYQIPQQPHLPLRPSKSLNYSRNRSNSSDSINELAESLIAEAAAEASEAAEDVHMAGNSNSNGYDVTGSSNGYEVPGNLNSNGFDMAGNSNSNGFEVAGNSNSYASSSGPQSMLLPSVIASRFSIGYNSQHQQQKSLPYMSSSLLIDSKQLNPRMASASSKRTCELEEYARRYEATNGRRQRLNPEQQQQQQQQQHHHQQQRQHQHSFWQQKRPSLQHDPQYFSSRSVWNNGGSQSQPQTGPSSSSCSGRESVATVMTNSSSETVKYQGCRGFTKLVKVC